MLKMSDIKVKSISDAKKEFSRIVKEAEETGEPTFILNHNRPEAVILSNKAYEELVERNRQLEEQLLYSELNKRVEEGPGELRRADQVIHEDNHSNRYANMSDEELFD